ncbi:hypothetical protein HY993_04180 [Candidatus Micrarchaeota archaeon]|nr:hypothetical protein [Candidatus Micrarchaeota archaeon]
MINQLKEKYTYVCSTLIITINGKEHSYFEYIDYLFLGFLIVSNKLVYAKDDLRTRLDFMDDPIYLNFYKSGNNVEVSLLSRVSGKEQEVGKTVISVAEFTDETCRVANKFLKELLSLNPGIRDTNDANDYMLLLENLSSPVAFEQLSSKPRLAELLTTATTVWSRFI